MNSKREEGMANFRQGYNCTQAVVLAYCDRIGMDREQVLKIAQPFGGGMGRMRQVCGAVSGMFIVAGALEGCADPKNVQGKKGMYDIVQKLAAAFEKRNGSIICGQLLGLSDRQSSVSKEYRTGTPPEPRTEMYYKKRPCENLIGDACEILEELL